MTYDQRSHGIVHVRHLYESHLSVLREELKSFHSEAVLSESILDFFLRYRSSERVNWMSLSPREAARNIICIIVRLLTECLINAGSSSADRCSDSFSSQVSWIDEECCWCNLSWGPHLADLLLAIEPFGVCWALLWFAFQTLLTCPYGLALLYKLNNVK